MRAFSDYDAALAAAVRVHAVPERIEDTVRGAAPHVRAIERCLAAALGLAALGLWVFPTADAAVALVKLGASAGLLVLGLAFWGSAAAARGRTRVEVDTRAREIRVHETDGKGRHVLTRHVAFAQLGEASLCNGRLVALDDAGRFVLSVPVRGRARKAAIRRALSLA